MPRQFLCSPYGLKMLFRGVPFWHPQCQKGWPILALAFVWGSLPPFVICLTGRVCRTETAAYLF